MGRISFFAPDKNFWGGHGIVAGQTPLGAGLAYALKYQEHIKGLIISNMMCSAPQYHRYAQEVLGPGLGADIFEKIKAFEAAGDYMNPEYISIIEEHHYPQHVLRKPMADWPSGT